MPVEESEMDHLNGSFSRKINVHIWVKIVCQFKCWNAFPKLKRGKNAKFSWSCDSPHNLLFGTNFFATTSLCSDSSQYAICIFFYFWDLKTASYYLFGHPWCCLIFTLSQTNIFSLEVYWKCLLHLLSWRNLVNNKNTYKKFQF